MKISGLFFLISAAISYVVWQRRKAEAQVRLRELDEGKRCISCDGTNLTQEAGVVQCLRCGHKISLEVLRSATVSASEIADVTKPPEDRRW
jgi:DNA-directed RNA polymerase subunit RPC12/RpoP